MSIQTLEFPLLNEVYYETTYNVTLLYDPFDTGEHCYSIQYLNQPHEIFVAITGRPGHQKFFVKNILTDDTGNKQLERTLDYSFSTLDELIQHHQKPIEHTVPHFQFWPFKRRSHYH